MPRNAEKRAYSREVDKIRKRTRRAIARLEKQEASTSNFLEKRAARQKREELAAQLANLSARGRGKTYTEKARGALESLKTERARVLPTRELKKRPIDFESELRKAKRGEISVLGAKGREKTQLFYRVTQNLWQGAPIAERNARIMAALGVDTLEVAYAKVFARKDVQAALRRLDTSGGVVADTDDMAQAYMEAERMQKKIDTPTAIMAVQLMESVKAYGAPA